MAIFTFSPVLSHSGTMLLLTLTLVLFIPMVYGEEPQIAVAWNTYNDTTAGFSIQYPEGSSLFFSASPDNRTISITDQNNVSIFRVDITRTNQTLSEIRTIQEEKNRNTETACTVSDGLLGGLPAVRVTCPVQQPGITGNNSIREIFAVKDLLLYSIRSAINNTGGQDPAVLMEDLFTIIPSDKPEKYWSGGYPDSWYYPGMIYDPFGLPYTTGSEGWDSGTGCAEILSELGYDPTGYCYPGYGGEEGYDNGITNPVTQTGEQTGIPSPTCTPADTGSTFPHSVYPTPTVTGTGNSGYTTGYQDTPCTIEPTAVPSPSPGADGTDGKDAPTNTGNGINALVVIAPADYNEEELDGTTRALDTSGIRFDIVSTRTGTATGMSGGRTPVTMTLDEVKRAGVEQYSGIILIGGEGAMTGLYDDMTLRELVKTFDQDGKIVAAICASPVILSRAGILQGKTVTLFGDPQGITEVTDAGAMVKEDEAVVTDGRIITGNGPYAAEEFGTTVAKALRG